MDCAEWRMFRGAEPVATFFTPIAWTAYILVADAAVLAVQGESRLRNAPREFARTALLSVPLWLVFEAYNLRLENWTYDGLPMNWLASGFGYAWSYATITPAIFVTADLIQSYGGVSRPAPPLENSSAGGGGGRGPGAGLLAPAPLVARPPAGVPFYPGLVGVH